MEYDYRCMWWKNKTSWFQPAVSSSDNTPQHALQGQAYSMQCKKQKSWEIMESHIIHLKGKPYGDQTRCRHALVPGQCPVLSRKRSNFLIDVYKWSIEMCVSIWYYLIKQHVTHPFWNYNVNFFINFNILN